jgi:hypothetical protein
MPSDPCRVPEDVRGAGTCLRGAPGCQVAHPHVEQLPTIRLQAGTGPNRP